MSDGGEPLLRVAGLTVRYGALTALRDMDWHVASGEILGIIGPNGAGKSSCFAAVTHAVPRQGEVWLAGERITLEAGDSISIPQGVWHQARAVGEQDAEIAICFSSADRLSEIAV